MIAAIQRTYRALRRRSPVGFPGSEKYWRNRYAAGGTSGNGSYDRLAKFKANFLNRFVERNCVKSVVELGCGDGNQLSHACYPSYYGVDVAEEAISICQARFKEDSTKRFGRTVPAGESFELAVSLDVIYHLIEDSVYYEYMDCLFSVGTRYVIIYSSNVEQEDFIAVNPGCTAAHVRHRRFSDWVVANRPRWSLVEHVGNEFPFQRDDLNPTSFSDFYVYSKCP